MGSNSDLEGEIGILPIRTRRTKLRFNSDLEEEITSDLGRNRFGPGTKSLRTLEEIGRGRNLEEEITLDLGRNHFGPGGRNWEEEIGRK